MDAAVAGVSVHRGVLNRPVSTTSFMNIASTILLAFAMSTDAFAAAVGKGAGLHKPSLREALRTGLIFGVIEAITPVVGWAAGLAAASYVAQWDHWIAVTLLSVLGLRMIHAGLGAPDIESDEQKPSRNSFFALAVTGFATSIDAMAVGVGLAFINVNIAWIALAIGLATMMMVTVGVMLGRVLGAVMGRRAEIIGGLILIGIGFLILYEHLNGAA